MVSRAYWLLFSQERNEQWASSFMFSSVAISPLRSQGKVAMKLTEQGDL